MGGREGTTGRGLCKWDGRNDEGEEGGGAAGRGGKGETVSQRDGGSRKRWREMEVGRQEWTCGRGER